MKKIFLALLFLPILSQAQIITTFAGTGSMGFSGNGGPATTADLSSPGYVTSDRSGNIYYLHESNAIYRLVIKCGWYHHSISSYNNAVCFSGDGGPATAASLNFPKAMAFDGSRNAYIADAYNYAVRKINTAGIITSIAGNGTNGYSGDGGPATAAELSDIHSVAADDEGNVYIADFDNHVVRKVDRAGIISTIAGNGTPGYSGDGGAATAAELNNPTDIALDAAGNVYIADARSYTVRMVNAQGIISTFAGTNVIGYGGDNGPATAATFNLPHAVAIDKSGNVYIADAGNNVIRKVNTSGIVSTIAGNGAAGYSGDGVPATTTSLNSPYGIAFDTSGNVYIADLSNNRIRKIINEPTSVTGVINATVAIQLYPNPTTNEITTHHSEQKGTAHHHRKFPWPGRLYQLIQCGAGTI